jgi:hypothetical protein
MAFRMREARPWWTPPAAWPSHFQVDVRLGAEPLDQHHGAADRPIVARHQMLGTDPDGHRLAGGGRVVPVERDPVQRDPAQRRAAARIDAAFGEVHLRHADEAGHEHVGGPLVQGHRRADLLHARRSQHHDAVGQRHRLDLVVRHVDHGRAQLLVQARDLHPHVGAQRGVQVRQRLVEQKGARLAHDGAADRDALALAAGQLRRLAFQQVFELEHLRDRMYRLADLRLRHARQAQPERDVLEHTHVRIQRIALEHHRQAALCRRRLVDALAVDADLALADLFQSRDHAQHGRLAAARRADQHDEFAVPDRKRDVLLNMGTAFSRVGLADPGQGNGCHVKVLVSILVSMRRVRRAVAPAPPACRSKRPCATP